jgi:serine/threonine-protein kinase
MITPDGTLKLTDFGIAKDLDATALTLPNRTLGTAAYMAPEQIKGTPDVSHKTDLYAFGCLLYQMLTGVTPFRGSTALVLMRAHAEEPPPRPSEKNPQIPRVLDNLVVKLMAKSPVDRPWDAQAVAAELRTLKEKLERGEPIKMAFGEPYVAPSRLAVAPTSPEVESRPQALVTEPSVTQDGTRKRKKRRKKGEGRALPSLGTIILGLALVVLLAGAFLLSRPKSMEQLYNDAKPLIESKKESQSERFEDWTTAEMRLEELEKRFPNHPYQKELQELHDKVALYKARGRARWIEGKRVKPQTDVEASYVATFTAADESVRQWQDHVAMQQWLRFVNEVEGHKDKSLRGWELLGRERAEELRVTMEQKRKELVKRLAQVQVAETSGEHELAIKLLTSVVEEFGQFGYLNDLVAPARAVLERAEQPPKEQ